MNFGLWRWLKEHRSHGWVGALVRLLERCVALLEIPTPDAEQLLQTLAGAERATDISREAQAALDRLKLRRKAPATKL